MLDCHILFTTYAIHNVLVDQILHNVPNVQISHNVLGVQLLHNVLGVKLLHNVLYNQPRHGEKANLLFLVVVVDAAGVFCPCGQLDGHCAASGA